MKRLTPVLVLVILIIDQLSKHLASRYLYINEPVEITRNIFYLTLVRNTGAAFGFFKNQTIFFIIISLLAVVSILLYLQKESGLSRLKNTALALILGGALSNLIDRLRFGYVVDFLDFRIWPVFNVADSAITVGAALLIISLLFNKRYTVNYIRNTK